METSENLSLAEATVEDAVKRELIVKHTEAFPSKEIFYDFQERPRSKIVRRCFNDAKNWVAYEKEYLERVLDNGDESNPTTYIKNSLYVREKYRKNPKNKSTIEWGVYFETDPASRRTYIYKEGESVSEYNKGDSETVILGHDEEGAISIARVNLSKQRENVSLLYEKGAFKNAELDFRSIKSRPSVYTLKASEQQKAREQYLRRLRDDFGIQISTSPDGVSIMIASNSGEALKSYGEAVEISTFMGDFTFGYDSSKNGVVISRVVLGKLKEGEERGGAKEIESRDNIFLAQRVDDRLLKQMFEPDLRISEDPLIDDPANEEILERTDFRKPFGVGWDRFRGGGVLRRALKG